MSTDAFDDLARNMLATVAPPRAGYSGDLRNIAGGGGSKYRGGLSASGRITHISHSEARRNARAAMGDSVQARAVVERSAATIADGGLRLELNPVTEVLGITREQATKWARDQEARFHLWAKDKKQHRSEQINWYQSQGQYQLFRHRDNDQFIRLMYESDPDLQNPLQFEFIDPDQIRGDALTTNYGFNVVNGADGIERDDRGREKGYKVWSLEPDGTTYKERTLPKRYPGGRLAMIHGFKGEYAGQGRGFTRMQHALQDFEKLTDFSVTVLQKAIAQSSIVGFIEPSKDEDATNVFEGILTTDGAGPAAKLFGSNPQAVPGVDVAPAAQPPESPRPGLDAYYRIPEATLDKPGTFIANLTKGSKITFPANTSPGDRFDLFVDSFMGYIASSYNIPLEVVLMKFGQNYSASRATLLLFWRAAELEREDMAVDYLDQTVEMWMAEEIAAGRCVAPGWSDPRMRKAWCNCSWIGSGPPDIDPAKSAKARQMNLEIGLTNVERESRDLNGTSAADNIAVNNETYRQYEPMPWNEAGNPPPGATAAPGAAVDKKQAKAIAAFLNDEIRNIVQEEIGNA